MSIEKAKGNLQSAANILKSDETENLTDAYSAATELNLELSDLPAVFTRQDEIKTEAGHRIVRITAQLQGIHQEMAALYELFDEGIEGSRIINRQAENARQKLDSVEEKVRMATGLVDKALHDGSSLSLFYNINQQEIELENNLPAVARLGQRREEHFETAKHISTKLGETVNRLDGEFVHLGKSISGIGTAQHDYDQAAEQAEPQRTAQDSFKLITDISITADEIRLVDRQLGS